MVRVEHELARAERDRASLELIQQQTAPAASARLGTQEEMLHLVAATARAIRDEPDAAASHRLGRLVVEDHEHPGGRLERRGLGEGRGVDDVLVREAQLAGREVRGEEGVRVGGVDG